MTPFEEFKEKVRKAALKETPGEYYGIMTLMLILEPALSKLPAEELQSLDLSKLHEHPRKLGLKMLRSD